MTEFPLPPGFYASWWQVRWNSIKPPGYPMHARCLFSWLLYVARQQKAFGALVVRDAQGKVAHVSILFPAVWFKSDFMNHNDVEIACVYTEPRNRELGLAKYGVQECLRSAASLAGWCWYVVRPDNGPSIHVAEVNQFVRFGIAHKRTCLGFEKLGKFVATDANKAF